MKSTVLFWLRSKCKICGNNAFPTYLYYIRMTYVGGFSNAMRLCVINNVRETAFWIRDTIPRRVRASVMTNGSQQKTSAAVSSGIFSTLGAPCILLRVGLANRFSVWFPFRRQQRAYNNVVGLTMRQVYPSQGNIILSSNFRVLCTIVAISSTKKHSNNISSECWMNNILRIDRTFQRNVFYLISMFERENKNN